MELNLTAVRRDPLTKIVATVGPASSDESVIRRLIQAGVSIFRFNFSHGTLEEHDERLRVIRRVARELDRPTAVLGDLQGPKTRLGEVAGDGIELADGQTVVFQREPIVAQSSERGERVRFSSSCSTLVDDVEPGERVLINDGSVRLLVVEKRQHELLCTVMHGGLVTSRKGVNLPDTTLNVSSVTDRDWQHVRWAIENDLDMLALSFVRAAKDVHELIDGIARTFEELGVAPFHMPVIAKIETPAAVHGIDSIVDVADGIMIARGDLGVEMELARVPVVQRRLIEASQDYGKPCIVATQMLESMINAPMPTRAEANDVATAIFDSADAVMLSGETAVGRFPALAVEQMVRIALAAEAYLRTLPAAPSPPKMLKESRYHTAALAHGVWTIADDIGARCIGVWSQKGGGARYLSQNNFRVPIVAMTSDERVARQMQMLFGVTPVCEPMPDGVSVFTRVIDRWMQEHGVAEQGDACVLMAREPLHGHGLTNALAIHIIGDPDSGFAHHRPWTCNVDLASPT
jgi:pyruvate kinase